MSSTKGKKIRYATRTKSKYTCPSTFILPSDEVVPSYTTRPGDHSWVGLAVGYTRHFIQYIREDVASGMELLIGRFRGSEVLRHDLADDRYENYSEGNTMRSRVVKFIFLDVANAQFF